LRLEIVSVASAMALSPDARRPSLLPGTRHLTFF